MMMLPEPTEVMPTRKPANSPIADIPANDCKVGERCATCSSILLWNKKKSRNADQENPDRSRNERIDAGAIDGSKMAQQAYPEYRSRNAAYGQCHNDFASNRSFAEVNPARTDLGDEVEESVRSDCHDRRYPEKKDQDRQQKHTAAHSGHTDQSTDHEADQDLFDEHCKIPYTPT